MTTVGNRAEVLDYFAKKAARYDEVDQQVYWRLSDELLWHLLTTVVLPELPAAFTFLDAGGGTGRWSQRIAAAFPESRGTLVDLSPDMLREARRKFPGAAAGRVRVLEGSIESLPELESGAFDLVFNFHNVLGFVADPAAVVTELARLTRAGGTVLSVVPNRFHAAYFNIALGRLDEASSCVRTSRGRFTADMPYMHLFTPGSMLELYARAGLTRGEVRGFPVATYPGFAETQIEGNTRSLSDLLADSRNFEQVYELEVELSSLPEAATRGNNLFAFARK